METQTTSLYASLLRDRHPVATANVATEDTPISGLVRFFRTPIGTVVSAELHGSASSLQDLAFTVGTGSRQTTANLAPLSSRNGSTFVGITHRFTVEDLLGKTVTVRAVEESSHALLARGLVCRIGTAQ